MNTSMTLDERIKKFLALSRIYVCLDTPSLAAAPEKIALPQVPDPDEPVSNEPGLGPQ